MATVWSLLQGLLIFCACVSAHHDATFRLISLNRTLGGRVQRVEPLALPCFSSFEGQPVDKDEAMCSERQANYTNPLYRRELPGGYMYDTSTINASDPASRDQCLLDPTNPGNPAAWQNTDCKLGNLPSWYIAIQSACDAVKAFKYANRFSIKLSIKNSGHTYLEDAGSKGSLLLWTRKLQKLRHHRSFIPRGCLSEPPRHAITVGAGIGCGEAYEFADKHNATVLCGYSPTVGLSGGWVMNGGHSSISNVYGLGVDRVLQFKIVTPDGKMRIANKCQNPDLFWALRGGGGGTFGLVLESTHVVEEKMPMAAAVVKLPTSDAQLIAKFMDLLVDTAIDLAEDGWGGHIYGTHFIYINPLISNADDAKASLRKILNFIDSVNGTSEIAVSAGWYDFFLDYVLSGVYSVGNLQLIGTQLAPVDLFRTEGKKDQLKAFFRDELRRGNIPYIPVDSPYLSLKNGRPTDTSVLPAWYDSLWEIGVGGRFGWNSTLAERQAVIQSLQEGSSRVAKLTNGFAYKNEANPFTVDWQRAWYGTHYTALEEIKQKYDPNSVLKCWGCVGWTKEDALVSSYAAFMNITA
ncbi:hypothetical protein NLG97_g2120 [Lecanicillium saksenae]|uniref:Uncharacterized protein n=1 Tax=Lecanicillium saksenae TaxID=468837 RepID=A0ACC1R1S4_9HYPO|nr:hypothetical protein NLG97_g2120 [Lecanicillium saksenae]